MLLSVGSRFFPPACITVTKRATTEDGTHDLTVTTYALPTAPLSLSPLWCISEAIGALYVDAAFRNNFVVKLSFVLLLVGSCFPLHPVLLWQKVWQVGIEVTTLRLWDLRAADCAIVAVSVMVHQWSYWSLVRWCGLPSGVTLLSGYILCCFWLAPVFRLQYVLPWQKVRQVRIELTTLRLWDLRAADCAIVVVSVLVHRWSYWNLVRKCGIPK